MVKVDGRDDGGQRRRNDVGGVVAAAKAHLQHHDIAVLAAEPQKTCGGDGLKLVGGLPFHLFPGGTHLFHDGAKLLGRDHLAVDLHPFPEIQNEGRKKQPGAVAGLPQHHGKHGGGAALAVGSGHMDALQALLGVAQQLHQPADAVQAGGHAKLLEGMDVCQCFGIGHRKPSFAGKCKGERDVLPLPCRV